MAQFRARMAKLGLDALIKGINGSKVDTLIDSVAGLVTPDNMGKFE